jgi:hypothetical protein
LSVVGLSIGLFSAGAALQTPARKPWGGSIHCATNLRILGQAMLLYANEHERRFPNDLAEIVSTQDVTPQVVICAHSTDSATTVPSTQITMTDLNLVPGHSSFVYLGKGLKLDPPAARVLAYDPLEHHPAGTYFLYGDWRVDYLPAPAAAKIIAELNAGHNPPRPENVR